MNRISFTLITLDEERNLPRALASIRDVADEIVVVDAGSRDQTCRVAHAQGARLIERPWTDYSEQKNFAASQASHDWIFSLDADEELSPELKDSVAIWKSRPPEAVAYRMRRKARYLGGWIHHSGWYPDPKSRLYRRDAARWAGKLHESLQVEGEGGWLEGDLLHHTFATLGDHARAVRRYTGLAAQERWKQGRRHWLLPLLFASPWAFFRTLIFQQGFRDGYRGVLIAWMAAYYVVLKYLRVAALATRRSQASATREPHP